MKTKIIYISGGELFEMAQIRAAFEEVKSTLGLGQDTILFGVPVDCDSAIEEITDTTPEIATVPPQIVSEITEIISDISDTEIPQTPDITDVETDDAPALSDSDVETPVVPILSVLAADDSVNNASDEQPADVVADVVTGVVADAEPEIIPESVLESIVDTDDVVSVTTASLDEDDITDNDVPDAQMEKTLEQLLESMTPLREDVTPHVDVASAEPDVPEMPIINSDNTDATLAQLASEFALNEDKIPSAPKPETSGKIGKLKNILPFKKAKREDNSLMGDLFGWAGIAANDEDFSIPGFFTPAKKQGA